MITEVSWGVLCTRERVVGIVLLGNVFAGGVSGMAVVPLAPWRGPLTSFEVVGTKAASHGH